jgi:hypothetical protein
VPQGVRAKQLDVSIKPQHLRVGIKELPPYLDVSRRPRQLRGAAGQTGLRAFGQRRHNTAELPGCCSSLQKGLGGAVKVSESLWTLEDGTLHIQLTKAEVDTTWASAIAGALPTTCPCAAPSPDAPTGAAMENLAPPV